MIVCSTRRGFSRLQPGLNPSPLGEGASARLSFDFDNDRTLRDFMVGQARNPSTPFSVVDHSLKEAAPMRDWQDRARRAIQRSEVVLVMVGSQTYRAPGVLREISMAREEGVRVAQIIGYRDGDYTSVPGAGRLYRWSWDNLKAILYNR